MASFGIISGSRAEIKQVNPKKNIDNTYRLGEDLRRAGYGYIRFEGGYPETNPETGETVPVSEYSLFVPGVRRNEVEKDDHLKGVLITEGKKFNQETILYRAFQESEIRLYDCATGMPVMDLEKNLSFSEIGAYWSRLRKGGTYASRAKFKFGT
jgi:hypothetical protein